MNIYTTLVSWLSLGYLNNCCILWASAGQNDRDMCGFYSLAFSLYTAGLKNLTRVTIDEKNENAIY